MPIRVRPPTTAGRNRLEPAGVGPGQLSRHGPLWGQVHACLCDAREGWCPAGTDRFRGVNNGRWTARLRVRVGGSARTVAVLLHALGCADDQPRYVEGRSQRLAEMDRATPVLLRYPDQDGYVRTIRAIYERQCPGARK